jgi:hypothetical protein
VKKLTLLLICLIAFYFLNAQKPSVSFEQWISLKQISQPVVSPNGAWVLYSIQSTDWSANRYDNELWLTSTKDSSLRFQLTRTNQGSSTNGQFSPDSKWVTFLADRGNKNQLYLISTTGGEAMPLTKEETGVDGYEWSPDGKQIAFLITNTDLMWKMKPSNKTAFGRYGSIMTVSRKRVCFPAIMKKKTALNLQIKIHALYCRCLNSCSKKIITSAILSGARIANISFLIFSQTAASKLPFFMLILHY